jgi:MFS family permease
MLVAARAMQGTAGGGLIQMVNITISDLFSMRRRSLWLGLLEVMWAIAGGVGPVVGGALAAFVSWRWCFWINLRKFCSLVSEERRVLISLFTTAVSGTAFLILLLFLDVHNPRTGLLEGLRAIDWVGR